MSTLLLVAALSVAGQNPTTRVEIRSPGKVTDGWVRTDKVTDFGGDELTGSGVAWSAYNTVLIRFNLGQVGAGRFGLVKKATLRLRALRAENAKKQPTVVAPSAIAWNRKATAVSPLGDKSGWPIRAMHPNINYAMIDDLAVKQVITKPGAIDFDITETVARWLYRGLPNHGLLVTASPPIFGMPNAGSWRLSFASSRSKDCEARPRLIIEFEGTPPRPTDTANRALALYPSASLPPVRQPYYFVYYNAGDKQQWRRMSTINVTTYSQLGRWLAPRGVMNLVWAEGGPVSWLPGAEAYKRYYTRTVEGTPVGLCGHESNLNSQQMPWLVDAFRSAKARHPERFLAYYYRGESMMAKAAGDGHIDLLIQEGYTSTHKQFPLKGFAIGMSGIKSRIDTARNHGAIERHVVMLGHICKPANYHPGHELTAPVIDRMIGQLRAYAPEMPGIGFYGVNGKKLAIECDRLARKHFVDPAPEVEIQQPLFEATLSTPHVLLQAQAKARNSRKVVRYRWFIDNRYVAETKVPRFLWDVRGERNGHHLITVHAIDEAWNRAACQIPVKVELRRQSTRN